MELKQNSNQCVILLHEIYGINSHIKHYANAFYQKGFDVYVPNLLQRITPFPYEEEDLAYQNFMTNVGFEKAQYDVNALINNLSNKYSHIRMIGFSIGATIAWLCSNNPSLHKVVGFYGSRIRQYTDVVPNAETILIFGEQEKSFNPIDLKTRISTYPHVFVKIVEGKHGFADPYSSKYNKHTTNDLSEYLFD
ncbi:dienelactone hydrolase [Lysinibacillus composti]|uniref:Dienelactone hydrolase family protein n=1 Tax=Lysinibacillus composti TaxID=720633 RepID=A0A3N9UF91_9BACI|nr:dienelactone hydrolase family protein [Lysinibacillus composti]MBM7608556.1 dienelactone hydrolase [Lysinibacillus composti]RQW74840.1 dienelactone hydrolase family protein [Lysinibacillus composti]